MSDLLIRGNIKANIVTIPCNRSISMPTLPEKESMSYSVAASLWKIRCKGGLKRFISMVIRIIPK